MLRHLLRVLAPAPALLARTAYAGAPDQVTNIFNPLSTPAESVHRGAPPVGLGVTASYKSAAVSDRLNSPSLRNPPSSRLSRGLMTCPGCRPV
jgi:hypothetical protein